MLHPGKPISTQLQTSLKITLTQQTLQHTMNFEEFSALKSDNRVSIQKLVLLINE